MADLKEAIAGSLIALGRGALAEIKRNPEARAMVREAARHLLDEPMEVCEEPDEVEEAIITAAAFYVVEFGERPADFKEYATSFADYVADRCRRREVIEAVAERAAQIRVAKEHEK